MKKEGSLKSILAILVIILLCLISFGGVFVKDKNIMKNIIPNYTYGMELDADNIFKFDVVKDEENSSENTQEESAEEKVTSDAESGQENTELSEQNAGESKVEEQNGQAENIYTLDNDKKTKSIIEKRLNKSGVQQYTVRLDEQTGSIFIEVPEKTDASKLQNAMQVGKLEIKIEETGEVIGDNSSISKVNTEIDDKYASYIGSYVKINFEFSSDAVKKFKEIKNNYTIPTGEDGQQKDNTIQIYVDGTGMLGSTGMTETEFLEAVVQGTLPLTLGGYSTDNDELNETLEVANLRKVILESDSLPLKYSAQYVETVHSNVSKWSIMCVFVILTFVMFVYLVGRYKIRGILAALSLVGFGAVLSLVLRYTGVQISIAAVVSTIAVLILQFIYLIRILKNKKTTASKEFNEETLSFSKMLIPAFIMSVIITFANIVEISGFGMVIFWGLILFEIFNFIITKAVLTKVKNN